MSKKSNRAKGRNSFDATVGNSVVEFFNRNVSPYPTEAGGPKFDLIPIQKQKDIMVNTARMHAEQEYNRIMQLVDVLQQQAYNIKQRLELTDLIHSAEYQFQLAHGQTYWLAQDTRKNRTVLSQHGPNDWLTGIPTGWEYICQVRWLGDYTWMEIK
jgi:hypothetical protein